MKDFWRLDALGLAIGFSLGIISGVLFAAWLFE